MCVLFDSPKGQYVHDAFNQFEGMHNQDGWPCQTCAGKAMLAAIRLEIPEACGIHPEDVHLIGLSPRTLKAVTSQLNLEPGEDNDFAIGLRLRGCGSVSDGVARLWRRDDSYIKDLVLGYNVVSEQA